MGAENVRGLKGCMARVTHLVTGWPAAGLCGAAALSLLPSLVGGQNQVQGATLGVTTLTELRSTRGEPADTGKNVDGWLYVTFGQVPPQYTYYFSPEDSIIEWARVFVIDGYSAKRVHEAFGRPDTTVFGVDLSKNESFKSGKIIVSYKPNGDVDYIEYHPDTFHSIGVRRARIAWAKRDSVLAEAIMQEHPALMEDQALDSLRDYRDARSKVRAQKPPSPRLQARAARLDSLCAKVDCDRILTASRAFDTKPQFREQSGWPACKARAPRRSASAHPSAWHARARRPR